MGLTAAIWVAYFGGFDWLVVLALTAVEASTATGRVRVGSRGKLDLAVLSGEGIKLEAL